MTGGDSMNGWPSEEKWMQHETDAAWLRERVKQYRAQDKEMETNGRRDEQHDGSTGDDGEAERSNSHEAGD